MSSDTITIAVLDTLLFLVAVFILYRVYEKRLREVSRRIDETPHTMRAHVEKAIAEHRVQVGGVVQAMGDDLHSRVSERTQTSIDALQQRVDQLAQLFQEYQQSTRTWIEKALESVEKRCIPHAARQSSDELEKIRRFKEELPRWEGKFADLSEKQEELNATVRRLLEQHKVLAEKIQDPSSEEEQKDCARQMTALGQSLARALASARDVFVAGDDAVKDLVKKMSPLFKVCDMCGEVREQLSICLNCGKKYCEDCKGLQIGHCKECAPYYRPLHLEVTETEE